MSGKVYLMGIITGAFAVASAWEINELRKENRRLRKKQPVSKVNNYIDYSQKPKYSGRYPWEDSKPKHDDADEELDVDDILDDLDEDLSIEEKFEKKTEREKQSP